MIPQVISRTRKEIGQIKGNITNTQIVPFGAADGDIKATRVVQKEAVFGVAEGAPLRRGKTLTTYAEGHLTGWKIRCG